MSKETVYYPNYQMRPRSYMSLRGENVFCFGGACLVTKAPYFGATETQKAALSWASHSTPPVICVKHGKPTKPDREGFTDPNELHRHYKPYAMSIATLECLGEEKPRQVKVYFCDATLHEHNAMQDVDLEYKDWYVVPLDEVSRSQAKYRLLS